MRMYDTIYVPCPSCGAKIAAQSKSGDCTLAEYELDEAPSDVLLDVNRHAPFECGECHRLFKVKLKLTTNVVLCNGVGQEK